MGSKMLVSHKIPVGTFPYKARQGFVYSSYYIMGHAQRLLRLLTYGEKKLVILSSAEREFYRIESKFLTVNVKLSGSGNSFCLYLRSDSGCPEYVS